MFDLFVTLYFKTIFRHIISFQKGLQIAIYLLDIIMSCLFAIKHYYKETKFSS